MDICVIGTGYVGLVTGTCLAELGNRVHCIDQDQPKIDLLQKGEVVIYEPGLSKLVKKNLRRRRLFFSGESPRGIEKATVIIITVDTPTNSDGSVDLTNVWKVAEMIGEHFNSDKLIIVKSTVPVGTCAAIKAELARILNERGKKFRFELLANPEFLREGSAVHDFMNPDRIVIGCDNQAAAGLARSLYAPLIKRSGCPFLVMDPQSAEITKYAANGLLATKISFINELAKLAELTGADITKVSRGVGCDRRIGPFFVEAGLGYGGSCFPKDIKSLTRILSDYGLDSGLLNAVARINQSQRDYFLQKIKNHFNSNLTGKTFAVWGLAFKPETDDLREAPSQTIINGLLAAGASVKVFDPRAKLIPEALPDWDKNRLFFSRDQYAVLTGADALIIITEWDCFKRADLGKIGRLLKRRLIFDGRNIFEPAAPRKLGFEYFSIGR